MRDTCSRCGHTHGGKAWDYCAGCGEPRTETRHYDAKVVVTVTGEPDDLDTFAQELEDSEHPFTLEGVRAWTVVSGVRRKLNPAFTLWALMWASFIIATAAGVRPLVSFGAGCAVGVLFIWIWARVWER